MRVNRYYMLVSSLPALPPRFEVERLPITHERLQSRLRMLEPQDAEEIRRMFAVFEWNAQFAEAKDAAVVKRYGELMKDIASPLIRELLGMDMDMRMVLAALRRRRQGLGPPTVGVGQRLRQINRNFERPDFGLGHICPWLVPFDQLLKRGDVLTLYRQLLGQAWACATKRMQDYDTFSFEAVVLYVGRWELMRRCLQLQPERGRMVFEALVTEAMGEYAKSYR
jgi:Protein of unknown function (DUF2764)